MLKPVRNTTFVALVTGMVALAVPGQALAWSCQSQYQKAEELIDRAEKLTTVNTDSRILSMLEQARGLADAGIISHERASEGHTGETGKYMHGDAIRKAIWAQDLAKEAYFLLTDETY